MSVYMTEEEQLEVIKKWWKRYGNLVSVFLSVILLCVAGYRYMHWHQDKLKQQASTTYENMMLAYSNQNIKSVRSFANQLIKDYDHTVYADVAHMTLAKIYVSKNKLDKAQSELRFVADHSNMTALKQIAKIRIARLMAAEKAYTNALKELTSVVDNTYLPVINELKGDIYGATGQYQEAINAYRLAIDEVKTNGMGNLFLEMKSNELALKNQTVHSNEKKVQAA
ncbi:YfgM family protein [Legionella worsleiensis]|uniref:Ancillary SecYEG translocon subunit n=1 Tax=Legionella worsleiensis TaxID=45076 RepID=A0A0W1AJ74_9GAMM|nr:tetratricopeptide repeat protein [Legionella worsleiensis]KTD81397.1 transmembrane protein [Legionella worsleiensis]STY30050.1 transmembrane protein [Legionella worsleiensis]